MFKKMVAEDEVGPTFFAKNLNFFKIALVYFMETGLRVSFGDLVLISEF